MKKPAKTERAVNFLARLFGGEDELLERVRSSALLKGLLVLSPVAMALRFGGFGLGSWQSLALFGFIALVSAALVLQWTGSLMMAANRQAFFVRRRDWTLFTLLLPGIAVPVAVFGGLEALSYVLSAHILVVLFVRIFLRILNSPACCDRPGMTLSLTFAAIIFAGALILWMFPRTTRPGTELQFIDCLFTSASATCVTGLESVSVAGSFTMYGQSVVMILIQIGGLGIMTFGAFFVLSTGRRLGLSDRELVREALNTDAAGGLFRQVVGILVLTAVAEVVGALLLYPSMTTHETPMFAAAFHAVSAFCNAGFVLFPRSLEGFAGSWQVNLVVAGLVLLGGLGFGVVQEVVSRIMPRRGRRLHERVSLHTRLALICSLVLVIVGGAGFLALEHDRALEDMSPTEQVLVSGFHSVSARTAGFQTVSFVPDAESGSPGLSTSTRFWILGLMIIGASPGSTGGGIKTVTFSILVLGIIALLRNRDRIEVLGRTISGSVMRRAAAIAVVYLLTLFVGVMALTISEGSSFTLEEILFEAASALGTVGFSVGVSGSPDFSGFGKLVLTLLMFAGRVGPLTLVLVSATSRSGETGIEYPEERVIIG